MKKFKRAIIICLCLIVSVVLGLFTYVKVYNVLYCSKDFFAIGEICMIYKTHTDGYTIDSVDIYKNGNRSFYDINVKKVNNDIRFVVCFKENSKKEFICESYKYEVLDTSGTNYDEWKIAYEKGIEESFSKRKIKRIKKRAIKRIEKKTTYR